MYGHKWFLKIGELSDASIGSLISDGFELIDCQYSFSQGISESGKAETSTRLSGLNLVYDGLPSDEILKWSMDSKVYNSGLLVLYDADNTPVEKIFFEDAACSSMRISYISDGDTYSSTQLTLSPRVLKIDDDVFRQPWTVSDVGESKKGSSSSVGKIFQPIGKTNARLKLKSGTYELTEFDVNFTQSVDYKGQPTADTTGGVMTCVISERPSKEINKWAILSNELMNGMVEFYQEMQSSPLKISFSDAYCIEMTPFRYSNGEMRTRLKISANELDLNGQSIYKNWKL